MKHHERILQRIASERERQIAGEGWTLEHDDNHTMGQLALAGAAYAVSGANKGSRQGDIMVGRGNRCVRAGWFSISALLWPFSEDWWKPRDRVRDLERAAALLVAEIERIERADAKLEGSQPE